MRPIDLIVTNGYIVTQNQKGDEYPSGAIAIEGSKIVDVGEASWINSRFQGKKIIDAKDKCIFPGLINTHTHLFQTFMKGLGEGIPLFNWLKKITTPGILHMTEEDFYLSAMIGCLDAIRSGTTTIVEFMYPNPYHEMGDAILQALIDSGIRALLGRGVADIGDNEGYPDTAFYADLLEPLDQALEDCTRLSKACLERGEDRINLCLAPPTARCINLETFKILRDFAAQHNFLITTHICETRRDNEVIFNRYKMSTVEFLDHIGYLNSNLLAVHCIYILEDGVRRFGSNNVKVSYNPVSNMYLGDGIAPIIDLMDHDVLISLGTDGAASNNSQDMLEVLKTGLLLQRANHQNPGVLSSYDSLRMATIDGARSINLSDKTGSIEPGKSADIIIANFNQPIATPYFNPTSTFVFSSGPEVVDTVIINGKVVLENKQFTNVNEEDIVRRAQIAAHKLAHRAYENDVLKTSKLSI